MPIGSPVPTLASVKDCQLYLAALPLGLEAMQNAVESAGQCMNSQVLQSHMHFRETQAISWTVQIKLQSLADGVYS